MRNRREFIGAASGAAALLFHSSHANARGCLTRRKRSCGCPMPACSHELAAKSSTTTGDVGHPVARFAQWNGVWYFTATCCHNNIASGTVTASNASDYPDPLCIQGDCNCSKTIALSQSCPGHPITIPSVPARSKIAPRTLKVFPHIHGRTVIALPIDYLKANSPSNADLKDGTTFDTRPFDVNYDDRHGRTHYARVCQLRNTSGVLLSMGMPYDPTDPPPSSSHFDFHDWDKGGKHHEIKESASSIIYYVLRHRSDP